MNTAYYIAKRYLFSKKSTHAINIISGISMLGVFVGSAALIVILSAFNGLEQLVVSLSNTITPDLRIEPAQGKSFDPKRLDLSNLKEDPSVSFYSQVLEEKALLRYGKQQFIGQIKGVDPSFLANKRLASSLVQGEFVLQEGEYPTALVGATVQYSLGINVNSPLTALEIYSPNKNAGSGAFGPADEFVVRYATPVGVFESNQDSDNSVIIALSTARELLGEPEKVSAVEVYLKPNADAQVLAKNLQQKFGKDFLVKDRIQQNALLYKILNSEKWAVYLILTFVLVIATFNIVGSLTMLVIDKQKDIAVLNSLGAGKRMIRQIFLLEGLMISFIGCIVGMSVGIAFAYAQMKYGFITMAQGNMVVNAYPMALKASDFVLVFVTVMVISFVASFISSRLSVKKLALSIK
ncbi:FtsX-like permease family protein [Pelobium manganitolerans]|uniref:FtsX-like permease family protein n=1 Tax=Pelobium manganitolerans TaxID=1842495 RepID=UPI003FA3866A